MHVIYPIFDISYRHRNHKCFYKCQRTRWICGEKSLLKNVLNLMVIIRGIEVDCMSREFCIFIQKYDIVSFPVVDGRSKFLFIIANFISDKWMNDTISDSWRECKPKKETECLILLSPSGIFFISCNASKHSLFCAFVVKIIWVIFFKWNFGGFKS